MMADLAWWVLPSFAGLVMLMVPVLLAARTNAREVAKLRDYVLLRRAHWAGTPGTPLQQPACRLAVGWPLQEVLKGRTA
jgi:hypothetical protein